MSERGGKREGAGRPTSSNPATKLVTIKMTPEQHQAFLERGGSRWVKRMLKDDSKNGVDMFSRNVNTDIKMPKKMLNALNRLEAISAAKDVRCVSREDVIAFLTAEYSEEFANTFKDEYLFSSPKT